MCTRPSMPPRSTKAPKSTMEETVPLRRMPFESFERISARSFLRPSSSSTRRDSTTLLRLRSISMTRASISVPRYMSRSFTRRRSTSDAGQEAAQADVQDQAALDHFDDLAGDHFAGLELLFDANPCALVLGALLGEDETAVLVLLLEHQGFDLLAQADDVGRVSVLADGQPRGEGMTPSLLNPMSTSTSSCSSLTTTPSTRSPSSKSVSVPSIISFICSSEMSEKSMTDVFLISVKTDPFRNLKSGDPSS